MTLGIYRGIGSPAAIDWNSPLATIAEGQTTITLPHHFPDQVVVYALAQADAPPLAVCYVLVNGQGELLRLLSRPTDLCLEPTGQELRLSWVLNPAEGFDWPEQFEVLRDDGAGFVPVLSVRAGPGPQFDVDLSGQSFPKAWAVRCRTLGQLGPMSLPLYVPHTQPEEPVLL